MAITDFERYPLTFGPSPIHPLPRLSAHLGGAQIWAKREDVNSGLAFGGNKTRKLEYFVPDALAQGADTLVSIGGYQSNHTRQVAAVAAKLGLKARLVEENWVDWPDPLSDRVGNILLSRIMGADVRLDSAGFDMASAAAGRMPSKRSRPQAARPTRSLPAGPTTGWAGWASPIGPTRWSSRSGSPASSSTPSSCAPSRAHRCRDDCGFCRPGQTAPRHRHRCVGDPAENPRRGRRIARNTAELIGLGRGAPRGGNQRHGGLGR